MSAVPVTLSPMLIRAALNVIDGADRVAQFLVEATRKRPGAWWREDFTLRFASINGIPCVVDAAEGRSDCGLQIHFIVIEEMFIRPVRVDWRTADEKERKPDEGQRQ